MAKTFRPPKAVSIRHLPSDAEDRKQIHKEHRERRVRSDKIKEERFAKIEGRRTKRTGKGRGIDIKVTGDN
jgi:hypothetical protein